MIETAIENLLRYSRCSVHCCLQAVAEEMDLG